MEDKKNILAQIKHILVVFRLLQNEANKLIGLKNHQWT
jgi:hypothetical protein